MVTSPPRCLVTLVSVWSLSHDAGLPDRRIERRARSGREATGRQRVQTTRGGDLGGARALERRLLGHYLRARYHRAIAAQVHRGAGRVDRPVDLQVAAARDRDVRGIATVEEEREAFEK